MKRGGFVRSVRPLNERLKFVESTPKSCYKQIEAPTYLLLVHCAFLSLTKNLTVPCLLTRALPSLGCLFLENVN